VRARARFCVVAHAALSAALLLSVDTGSLATTASRPPRCCLRTKAAASAGAHAHRPGNPDRPARRQGAPDRRDRRVAKGVAAASVGATVNAIVPSLTCRCRDWEREQKPPPSEPSLAPGRSKE
jgi:hypothetical protein